MQSRFKPGFELGTPKPKPVVFLDMDGVMVPGWLSPRLPNRDCVRRLNTLVESVDAVIVISSAWRVSYSDDFLAGLLFGFGLESPERVIGRTPDFRTGPRHIEIRAWLARQRPNPTRFLILDDDPDANIDGHLIRTENRIGFSDSDLNRALEMLDAPVRIPELLKEKA